MNQQTLTRRRLLHLGGVAGTLGLSDCTRFVVDELSFETPSQ